MSLNTTQIIRGTEEPYLKTSIPNLEVGDTIRVGTLIQEGNKERTQFSEGVIIAMHKAQLNTTITLRRTFQGIGIEKVYLVHSPRITRIQIIKKSKVKRAKLYYLRDKTGKATKLKQRFNVQ